MQQTNRLIMKVKFALLRKIESTELIISDSAYNIPQKDVEWCCNIIIITTNPNSLFNLLATDEIFTLACKDSSWVS